VDLSNYESKIETLMASFSQYNFNSVKFTVHIENETLVLKLIPEMIGIEINYHEVDALEHYTFMICRVLDRREIPYCLIENQVLDRNQGTTSLTG